MLKEGGAVLLHGAMKTPVTKPTTPKVPMRLFGTTRLEPGPLSRMHLVLLRNAVSAGAHAFAAVQVPIEASVSTVFLAAPFTAVWIETKVRPVVVLNRQ